MQGRSPILFSYCRRAISKTVPTIVNGSTSLACVRIVGLWVSEIRVFVDATLPICQHTCAAAALSLSAMCACSPFPSRALWALFLALPKGVSHNPNSPHIVYTKKMPKNPASAPMPSASLGVARKHQNHSTTHSHHNTNRAHTPEASVSV